MQKKLSIIIPVYNVSAYLGECLESLLAQTFTDFEALCVDDGSTDGSGEILKSFSQRDSRIKVFVQENKGVSAARNVGLENAKGEWIGFLDADDTIETDWFEKMMRQAKEGVDIVHAHSSYCFGGIRETKEVSHSVFLRDGWSFLNLIRREALDNIRYDESLRFKEDIIFFTTLALKTDRILGVNEKGYNYRVREGRATSQYIEEKDLLAFFNALSFLSLPREDFARAVGFDLIFWVKGRNRIKEYNPSSCRILEFWRRELLDGRLSLDDVRWWWRYGIRRWIKTGDLSLLEKSVDWRRKADSIFSPRAFYFLARIWGR